MRLLLDTHAFLWWITDDQKLSYRAREVINNGLNELFLSAASGWEIAIKARIGRLQLPERPEIFLSQQLAANSIRSLPIEMSHALGIFTLPDIHRDPFDRMIIAQSQIEGLTILTCDPLIRKYDVKVLW
jgi:PIN domain nuclease of toxin-antitoxin system